MTTPPSRPVIFISGASSGLGAAMAKHCSQWATVYGTTRTDAQLKHGQTLRMDVTDASSVQAAVDQVIQAQGRIDVLVNNAGVALSGAVETTPMEDVIRQFDVNCFGAMRVTQAALPTMRSQGSGTIVNIGSMAGSVAMPYRSCYAASKAALEIWAWALRLELEPFGVGVCCVQAGDCQTDLSSHAGTEFSQPVELDETANAYRTLSDAAQKKYADDEANGQTPDQMAKVIEKVIRTPANRLRFRYAVGSTGQRMIFGMRKILSDPMIETKIKQLYLQG